MTETKTKRLLKIGQVAQLLNLSVATLRNWDAQGILTAVRLPNSRQRMYRVQDVEALIEKLLEKTERPA